jgi:hypothetical protein
MGRRDLRYLTLRDYSRKDSNGKTPPSFPCWYFPSVSRHSSGVGRGTRLCPSDDQHRHGARLLAGGRLIIEHEQKGRKRAAYGETVLEDLGKRLTVEFGRGFDVTNLRKMRQFYRMFQIRDAVRLESGGSQRRRNVSRCTDIEKMRPPCPRN